jgi:predicted N-acetyltransferase YhbS
MADGHRGAAWHVGADALENASSHDDRAMTQDTTPSEQPAPRLAHLCQAMQGLPEPGATALLQAVAAMIHAEFWGDVPGASADGMAARLRQACSADALPLCRVALDGAQPVGVVNLIDYDDPNPRVGTPWLAGMVVAPAWRGLGLGSRLVRTLLDDARRLGQRQVFLGTDGPGFYTRLGAVEHQRLRSDFWLMRFDLSPAAVASAAA